VKYVQHYFDTNIIIDKDFLRWIENVMGNKLPN
jgi:hypothetical protein